MKLFNYMSVKLMIFKSFVLGMKQVTMKNKIHINAFNWEVENKTDYIVKQTFDLW